jgi:uncharacterized protein (DUF983 family)
MEAGQPFPDYVICPWCGEPEVEVWCYETRAHCHACGRDFDHTRPAMCQAVCPMDSADPGQVTCS